MAKRKLTKPVSKASAKADSGCMARVRTYGRYTLITFGACCIITFILSLFAPETDETAIPTLRVLPSVTATIVPDTSVPETEIASILSPTPVPSATNVPSTTVAAANNQAALAPIFASATAAMLQAQSIRPTVRPSATSSIPTALPTARSVGMTMYINESGVRARACPRTDCEIVTTLSRKDTVTVYGTIEGTNVSGNSLWYEMDYNGRSAFVHSAFVQQYEPSDPVVIPAASINTSSSNQSQTTWNCSGDRYNCSDFSTCSEVMSYWNTCPGDPSGLDGPVGSSSSGVPNLPCESLCG